MELCRKEQEFVEADTHPKLRRFVSEQIDHLAQEMGFSPRQIKTREFRARREGGRLVQIVTD